MILKTTHTLCGKHENIEYYKKVFTTVNILEKHNFWFNKCVNKINAGVLNERFKSSNTYIVKDAFSCDIVISQIHFLALLGWELRCSFLRYPLHVMGDFSPTHLEWC